MPQPIKMKVQIAPPSDPRFNDLFAMLEQDIEVTVPDGFLTGGIVTTLPTQDIGPVVYLNTWYFWDTNTNQYLPQQSIPLIGLCGFFAMNAIDSTHWLVADGRGIPRVSPYDKLFSAIGTAFGNGDGSSTFNIPDLRGRVPIGAGQGSTHDSNNQSLTNRTLATYVGEEAHILTAAELPILDGTGSSKPAGSGSAIGYSATPPSGHNVVQPSTVLIGCICFS